VTLPGGRHSACPTAVRGRRATPEEEQRLWPRLDAMNPGYREYRAARTRPMPVVILERQVGR
jgi:hypothetical protein